MAVAANIVEKSGSWFAYNGEKIGQGRDNAKNYLSANPAVMEEIKNRLLAQIEDKKGKAESSDIDRDFPCLILFVYHSKKHCCGISGNG